MATNRRRQAENLRNPDFFLSRAQKKLRATPLWAREIDDHQKISNMKKLAKQLSVENGFLYHLDHIVPICGENVCGLHVSWNIRVLPASENLSKGNKLVDELLGA